MIKINGTTIEMTRGDTLRIKLDIDYELQEGDEIRFGVKTSYTDDVCLIEKKVENLEIHLEPNDTKGLDFGSYFWDCQITFANGDVNTFITKAKLKIKEEVV